MPVTYLYTENTLAQWRTYTNIIGANVGDLDRLYLPFPGNVDLVSAINSIYSILITVNGVANATATDLGNVKGLNTNANTNIIMAINELHGNIGPLPNLRTSANTNLVYAINEIYGNVGILANLKTNANANAVVAINELWGNVGPLPNLYTTANANIVYAVNELYSNIGNLLTLNTTNKTTIVGSINDILSNVIGNLYTLNTTVNTNIVAAINDVMVGENDFVVGNIDIRGEFTTRDSLLELASNNLLNPDDVIDIGFFGKTPETFYLWSEEYGNVYIREGYSDALGRIILEDASGNVISEDYLGDANTIVRHVGLFRDASQFDNRFVFFANLLAEPEANIIDTSNISYALANVAAEYFIGNLRGWADWARQIWATNVIENGNTTYGNVFFQNTRSRQSIGVTGLGIDYNPISGIFSLDFTEIAAGILGLGNANLYYTNARAQAFVGEWLTFADPLNFDSVNGIVDLNFLDTDNVPEGNVNFYFSNALARNAISNVGNILLYDPLTGELSINTAIMGNVVSVNAKDGEVTLNTDEVPEGPAGNLYFTTNNWLARLAFVYTSNIAEDPNSNLANTTIGNVYFTNARARAAVGNAGPEINYDRANGLFSLNVNAILAGVSSVNGANGNVILYTSNIAENPNSNLANTTIGNVYFTNARARHAISVIGAATYTSANGEIYVPGPYGLAYKRFIYTLGTASNVITGPDDNGHTLLIDMAAATDVYVNGIRAISGIDFTINNSLASSNVLFNTILPIGTRILTQEITGNLAVSQGYVTETRTDYLEPLNLPTVPANANVFVDLAYGANTVFSVNVNSSMQFNFINPPLTTNKAFVFTIFTRMSSYNDGSYSYTWPANVHWDDDSTPPITAIPDRTEAYSFWTLDNGNVYYGYKNLSAART
jgi:hypothetical protein